jgi:hypothetical protein
LRESEKGQCIHLFSDNDAIGDNVLVKKQHEVSKKILSPGKVSGEQKILRYYAFHLGHWFIKSRMQARIQWAQAVRGSHQAYL